MKNNKDEIIRLMNNLGEVGLTSLIQAIDLYMEQRFLDEFVYRIENEDINPKFEHKMRGIAEFKKYVEEFLKD